MPSLMRRAPASITEPDTLNYLTPSISSNGLLNRWIHASSHPLTIAFRHLLLLVPTPDCLTTKLSPVIRRLPGHRVHSVVRCWYSPPIKILFPRAS